FEQARRRFREPEPERGTGLSIPRAEEKVAETLALTLGCDHHVGAPRGVDLPAVQRPADGPRGVLGDDGAAFPREPDTRPVRVTERTLDLSMVLPTYNERDRLEELVDAVFRSANAARITLEMVVVDDNSPDGTGTLADRLAANRRMKVVHRAGKFGLGTAVVE